MSKERLTGRRMLLGKRTPLMDSGKLAATVGLCVFSACSVEQDEKRSESTPAVVREQSAEVVARAADRRPSVVLVVFDTLRADAVSAYGDVEGTTPNLDALAKTGLRYEHAFAPSPWTVSSHASLFSGLRVDEHGVGLDGLAVVPERIQMLAEDFQAAGYTTASFAENAAINEKFGFQQGFDRMESPDLVAAMEAMLVGEKLVPFGILDRLRDWNRTRDKTQPYFLFVNLFEAHDPYEVRETNAWVSPDVSREELDYVSSAYVIPEALCDAIPTDKHLEALRGLYLGDVAAADAKFGALLEMLDASDGTTPRLVVATSDHGEHLGENRLMGHQFTVRNVALHVPLVVAGLPNLEPATIGEPVELRHVGSSLRCWALGEACSQSLPVEESPVLPSDEMGSTPIFSIYSDSVTRMPGWILERFEMTREQEAEAPLATRAKCEADDRVFGEMVSMIRYPMKITWFSSNDFVLHDLRWDRPERSDQMGRQPEIADRLRSELEDFVRTNVIARDASEGPELSEEAARTLESLGYIR
jgi:hypothetical protein